MAFSQVQVEKNFYIDSVAPKKRGSTVSVSDMFGEKVTNVIVADQAIHDTNFAFLTTQLAKLHTTKYEPKVNVTYTQDVNIDVGGGFVDYVSYFTVDWAGIMNEFRNVTGNSANYIPRVNAGLNQIRVNVYTFEVAYDLRFVEMEKMKQLTLQKSIQDIYSNAIVAGWDFFVQGVAYVGIQGQTGLFNDEKVLITTIDNSTASIAKHGWRGMSDESIVSFFNGVFELYLKNSNMNIGILPDTFLLPTPVASDLTSRFNDLYTSTLRTFIQEHNLGTYESDGQHKIRIAARPVLNDLGTTKCGRIVAYRNHKDYVRLDVPYPMQHFITLPNIERHSYTSAFVGQVSQIQLPYNVKNDELGVVTYWDFIK